MDGRCRASCSRRGPRALPGWLPCPRSRGPDPTGPRDGTPAPEREGRPGAGPCSPGPRGRPFQKPPQTALCSAATARSAAPTRTRRCKGSGSTSWAWPRGPQHVRISESPGGLNSPPAQGSGCELRAGGGGRLRCRHRGRRWAEWAVPGSGHTGEAPQGPSPRAAPAPAAPRPAQAEFVKIPG